MTVIHHCHQNPEAISLQARLLYRASHVLVDLGRVDLDLGSSPGWWADTVATYCPSRVVEHPKSNSTKPSLRGHIHETPRRVTEGSNAVAVSLHLVGILSSPLNKCEIKVKRSHQNSEKDVSNSQLEHNYRRRN